ncbi:MAG: RNA 2',3'-cyclic phosphodiesterase [Dehalococcoidia bacterium]
MIQGPDTLRVFIALDLPEAAKEALARTIDQLQKCIAGGVRWVDPGGIHLTLKFLGNIDASLENPLFDAMARAAEGFPSFGIYLEGLGAFPNQRQPRVLWAGAAGDLEMLSQLQGRVEHEISPLGFPREQRGFNPHLTLGRVRDRVSAPQRRQIGDVFARESLAPSDPWVAKELHLIRTNFRPQGNFYTSMGSVPLTGTD